MSSTPRPPREPFPGGWLRHSADSYYREFLRRESDRCMTAKPSVIIARHTALTLRDNARWARDNDQYDFITTTDGSITVRPKQKGDA